jgi:hypothetical protein
LPVCTSCTGCVRATRNKHRSAIASFEMRIAPYVRDVLREHFIGKATKDLTLPDKRRADEWIEEMFVFIDQDPRKEEEDATIEWIIERGAMQLFGTVSIGFFSTRGTRSSTSEYAAKAKLTIKDERSDP